MFYTLKITISEVDFKQLINCKECIALFRWVDNGYGLKESDIIIENNLVWYVCEPALFIHKIWNDEFYLYMSLESYNEKIQINASHLANCNKQYKFNPPLFYETIMEGSLIEGAYYINNVGRQRYLFGLAQMIDENILSSYSSLYPLNKRTLANGSTTYLLPIQKLGIAITPQVRAGQIINIDRDQIIRINLSNELLDIPFLTSSNISFSANDSIEVNKHVNVT